VGSFVQTLRIYSSTKGERFDTTISVVATISAGVATLALPIDSIDFGDVSTCSFAEASFAFSNDGCDSLRGGLTVNASSDFVMSGSTTFSLGRKESSLIGFTFRPTQLGLQTATVTITSNSGVRTVVLRGVGINGSGTVQGFADSVGALLTCYDTSFNISLVNTACDTVFFDSVVVNGSGSADYQIPTAGLSSLAVSDTLSIVGSFSPTVGGQRPISVTFYFHSRLGTVYQIPIVLNGMGIEPPRLQLSMPSSQMLVEASTEFAVPVDLQGVSARPVSTLTFSAGIHMDFVTPDRFELAPQFDAIAAIDPLVIINNTVSATIRFTEPTIVQGGKLGDLYLRSFITDTTETSLTLTDFTITDSVGAVQCLPSGFDSLVIHITLDPNCGDILLSKYLGGQLDLVGIASIKPNPTTGQVTLHLTVPGKYEGSYAVEMFDMNGKLVLQQTLSSPLSTVALSLKVPAGNYQVRVTSKGGTASRLLKIVR
jgi:hypothetical protein